MDFHSDLQFENATINDYLRFVFEETCHRFRKVPSSFQNVSVYTKTRKASVFKKFDTRKTITVTQNTRLF